MIYIADNLKSCRVWTPKYHLDYKLLLENQKYFEEDSCMLVGKTVILKHYDKNVFILHLCQVQVYIEWIIRYNKYLHGLSRYVTFLNNIDDLHFMFHFLPNN